MDFSHIEFAHKSRGAGARVMFAGKYEVIEGDGTIWSNWWLPNVSAPSHTQGIYSQDMTCDHWLDMRSDFPGSMRLQIGSTPGGRPREVGVIAEQRHNPTPGGPGKTHKLWATDRHIGLESREFDEVQCTLSQKAFDEEDKPMVRSPWENREGQNFWDGNPVSLGNDARVVRVRRRPKGMLARENLG